MTIKNLILDGLLKTELWKQLISCFIPLVFSLSFSGFTYFRKHLNSLNLEHHIHNLPKKKVKASTVLDRVIPLKPDSSLSIWKVGQASSLIIFRTVTFMGWPCPKVSLLYQSLCTCTGAGFALKEPSPTTERKSALTCHAKGKGAIAEEWNTN